MRNLDAYSHDYESIPFERIQEKFRRKAVNRILSGMFFDRALEVGCGLNSALTEVGFGTADVVEPMDLCITEASRKLGPDHLARIVFHKGLAEEVLQQSPDLTNYDLIFALSIIHEVQDPEALLRAMRRALSTNGTIVITLTNTESIHRILGREMGAQGHSAKTPMEIKMQQTTGAMSVVKLQELLAKCGLKASTMSTFFPKLLPHSEMQILFDKGVIDDSFLDQMFELGDALPLFGSEIICLAIKA